MIRPFDEKILNYIKAKGLISEETLKNTLEILQASNKDIQTFLIQEKILSIPDLIKIMSEILNWEIVKIENPSPDPEVLKIIPKFLTKFYNFIPLKVEDKTLHIGFTIPIKPAAIDDINLITGYSVIPYILDTSSNLNVLEESSENLEIEPLVIPQEEENREETVIEIKEEEVESLEKVIAEIQEEEKKEEKRSKLIAEKIVRAVKDKLPVVENPTKTERTIKIPRRKLLGEILVEEGVITKEQLEKALEESNKRGKPLGETLLELKFINDYQLAQALSIQLGFPFKSLKEVIIDPNIAKIINFSKARQDLILPLYKENNKIVVAMVDPANIMALDDIKMITKCEIEPVVVPKNEFLEVISRLWATQETEKLIEDLIKIEEEEREAQEVSLEEISEEGPTAKLVNSLLLDAVTRGASDIHIEPMEKSVRVRFRIDGVLHEIANFPKKLQAPIVSRIKIISDMDIAERRVPQDGRIKMLIRGNTYDFRVSTLPGIFGEKVVLRILGRSEISLSLESLGFSDENYKRYLKMLKSPYGIILVTGPTGSGKSTTLYASLNMINSPDINIITVEDPVEYQLPGIHQVQVNPKAGLTFANALRSILRQDPDVVLVGEIRDEETARIAIQAALTGHLVLSTLHTNDAPSTVTRLIDMGIEPFLISSSLLGVVAQRLVRKICPRCKTPYEPTPEDLEVLKANLPDKFDPEKLTLYKGKGCGYCNNKGYKGRTAIHEIMLIDDEIRELILKKVSKDTIRETARKKGMNTLREDGLLKVLNGITTIEEVMRVTAAD
ncbi:MAG: type IV-A pilus assembly ATPase PilB [Dictyoglomaceae bacterium]